MAKHQTNQRQRGNAALQLAALSALPLQTSLQVPRKLVCTKPPIKDAQPLPCCAQGAASAPGANAAAPANAALLSPEKIAPLTPAGGVESPLIAPAGGVESASTAPGDGAIRPSFCSSSTPGDGDHLEKPSVSQFKPSTSEKFSASHHDESSTALKGKQPILFTGGAALCYIATKPRGPVCDDTIGSEVATPTVKRGFVMPRLLGQVRQLASSFIVTGEMGLSARTSARLNPCHQHLVHLMRVMTQKVASRTRSGAKTMIAVTKASHRAAPSPTTIGTADPIQLHADAHNALNMAVFYLRQPDANVAGARRKAIQALTALRGLSLALEG